MAKRIPLSGVWTLRGEAAHDPDGVETPIELPGSIEEALKRRGLLWGSARYGEWMYLRLWRFSRPCAPPSEPPEGRSERFHLYLGALRGRGGVYLDGQYLGPLTPYGQVDISQGLLSGGGELEMRFFPALEKASAALPALPDAPVLVASYFARIVRAEARGHADGTLDVSLEIEGCGEGRILCKYRLTRGDELAATLNEETRIKAMRQKLQARLEAPEPVLWPARDAVYTLHVTLERGGARCDSLTLPVCFRGTLDAEPPLLLASVTAPGDVEGLSSLGVRGACLPSPAPDELLSALDEEGLFGCAWFPPGGEPSEETLERGLSAHPCAVYAGGLGFRFADGSQADLKQEGLRALDTRLRATGLLPCHALSLPELEFSGAPGLERACSLFLSAAGARLHGEKRLLPMEAGLLRDREGRFTAEAAALRAASTSLCVLPRLMHAPFPGGTLRLDLCPVGQIDRVYMLEAALYAFDGLLLKSAAFPLSPYGGRGPFPLEAALPALLSGPPLLRLRLTAAGETRWALDLPLCLQDGETAAPRLRISREGAGVSVTNEGQSTALGLLSGPEPELFALLPGERRTVREYHGPFIPETPQREDTHVSS